MKTKLLILLSLTLTLHAYADSATWNLNPVSGGWTDPLNWTPATVPNGPADTATFGVSNTTSVFINHFAIEVEGIVFEPGAGQYDFSVLKPLTISGTGITNNSGIQQFFVITSLSPVARFINSAT